MNGRKNITEKTYDWATQAALKTGLNSCDSEGLEVSGPLVAPVALLLNDTNIMEIILEPSIQLT